VYESNAHLGADVVIPPGDDLGMVHLPGGAMMLAGVDQLVADRHYDPQTTALELIGRKAMTRSLSDIAAMAAVPVASLAAVVLPPDFGEERAEQLFEAMRAAAAQYDCPLIGGDIALHTDPSHPLTCSTTVIARPLGAQHPPRTRGLAQPGDGVYVTGRLGGSLASGRHLTFEPRIQEAIALYEMLGSRLHAMIDLSDGLGRDAGHIAEMSKVMIEIDAGAIPCSSGNDIDWKRAVSDGEDYELCFTATGDVPQKIAAVEITKTGRVCKAKTARDARVFVIDRNQCIDVSHSGWEHRSP